MHSPGFVGIAAALLLDRLPLFRIPSEQQKLARNPPHQDTVRDYQVRVQIVNEGRNKEEKSAGACGKVRLE